MKKTKGIYDAFNKGTKISSGKFICIVNSGDTLRKNALKLIFEYLKLYDNLDFIFGSVKKHWGIVHGYRPEKIHYSWDFTLVIQQGFILEKVRQ